MKKIIGIIICLLLIGITVLPGSATYTKTDIFPKNKSIFIAIGIIDLRTDDEYGEYYNIEVDFGFILGFYEGKYDLIRLDNQNISIYENNILFSIIILYKTTVMILQT